MIYSHLQSLQSLQPLQLLQPHPVPFGLSPENETVCTIIFLKF